MRETSLADWLAEGDDDLPPEPPPQPGPSLEAGEPRPERQPRRRLWLVAAAAWALVAALGVTLVTGAAGEGEPAVAGDPAGTGEPAGVGAGGSLAVPQQAGPVPAPSKPAAGPGEAAGPREAVVATAAAMTVRLARTTHDEESGTSRYVDLALPARVTWLGDLAIVTVDAVVLEGDHEGWGAPRAVRYVQPMRLGDAGPVPAGRAWTVPPGGGEPAPPDTEPVEEPGLVAAVAAALEAAGYAGAEVREVGRARDRASILVVTVEARAPGESRRAQHSVWIAAEGDLRVLGTETSDWRQQEREPGP